MILIWSTPLFLILLFVFPLIVTNNSAASISTFQSKHDDQQLIVSQEIIILEENGTFLRTRPAGRRRREDEISILVQLWDLQGNIINGTTTSDTTNNNNSIPRYLVGRIIYSNSSSSSHHHHFTFDLGNPGMTTFLDPKCRGCDPYNSTTTHCPSIVPLCDDDDYHHDYCWPSHRDEYLPYSSFQYSSGHVPCTHYGDKVTDAGTIHGYQVCRMCFDSGDHSRYFIPSQANDLFLFSGEKQGETQHVFYPLPSPFTFGALIRTVPLQDRIWSNIGIGYHSSFLNQTGFKSIQFVLQHPMRSSSTRANILRFNPRLERYMHATATQRYRTPHHRVHQLDGFFLGPYNGEDPTLSILNNNYYDPTTAFSEERTTTATTTIQPFDFIMDTGDGGICIADPLLKNQLAYMTEGKWVPENVVSTVEHLVIDPLARASDLNLVFTPGIVVTMKGYMWALPFGRTIFVTCEINVLGLPFMASGVELVFDDTNKMLFMMGENVHVWNQTDVESFGMRTS